MKNAIWITWEIQRRNRSITRELGIDLFEIVIDKPRVRRYISSILSTVSTIRTCRPSVLIIQNPSIVLALLSLLLRKIFHYKLIVDEHYAGMYPLEGSSSILNMVARMVVARADHAIVTNADMADIVASWGGNPLILADPLPDLEQPKSNDIGSWVNADKPGYRILCVCGWSADEPVQEIIESTKYIRNATTIAITGNHRGSLSRDCLPSNVELTGYLPESEYLSRLRSSDAIMVLTDRENCLNCGAYEAVAAGKPLILSNKIALREYFNRGVVFTENSAIDIAGKIDYVVENSGTIRGDILLLRKDLASKWQHMKKDVTDVLDYYCLAIGRSRNDNV